jgi:hypothetical protein
LISDTLPANKKQLMFLLFSFLPESCCFDKIDTVIHPENVPMKFSKMKPTASISWLIAAAGFTWSAVGILMLRLACGWLGALVLRRAVLSGISGMTGAVIAYHFVFSGIAQKNLGRISLFPGKACFFAFQAWKSYFVIVIMITLGGILRHSAIPREYLAALYLTIGGALLLSSLHYYIRLWLLNFRRKP